MLLSRKIVGRSRVVSMTNGRNVSIPRALPPFSFPVLLNVQLPFFEHGVQGSQESSTSIPPAESAPPIKISMSQFMDQVEDRRIDHVDIRQDESALIAYDNITGFRELVVLPEKFNVVDYLLKAHVQMLVVERDDSQSRLVSTLMLAVQIGFLLLLVRSVFGGMGGGGGVGGPFKEFTQSRTKVQVEPETGTTFDDVAGAVHAKADLIEVVDFLKKPRQVR
jgi:ATP-dependent Zn protease